MRAYRHRYGEILRHAEGDLDALTALASDSSQQPENGDLEDAIWEGLRAVIAHARQAMEKELAAETAEEAKAARWEKEKPF